MEATRRIIVAICCPMLGLALHELTHIVVAKYQGVHSIQLQSIFPTLQLRLSYPHGQQRRGIQFMAIAPFILGIGIAFVMVISGLWRQIQLGVPYYIEGVLILSWAMYSHLSPVDIRTIFDPCQRTLSS